MALLAGSTARFHADPHHWDGGELERGLALELTDGPAAFDRACQSARKIVSLFWREISAGQPRQHDDRAEGNQDHKKHKRQPRSIPLASAHSNRPPGGYKVTDANGQSLAYVYSRDNDSDAHIANGGAANLFVGSGTSDTAEGSQSGVQPFGRSPSSTVDAFTFPAKTPAQNPAPGFFTERCAEDKKKPRAMWGAGPIAKG